MKNKFYIFAAIMFASLGSIQAQVAPLTLDLVALPTTPCPTLGGTTFPPPSSPPYAPTSALQIGVNNTGTDICQQIYQTPSTRVFQAMVWDKVTQISPLVSTVFVSFNFNDVQLNSFSFPNAYDPDVAIWSDATGTFAEVVFENTATNQIDGYTYYYNTTTGLFALYYPQKSVMRNDATKKAKNPNVAATKDKGRFAVVWHEEGLVVPGPSLMITYNTNPVQSFSSNISMLESKVYIYCLDKTGYLSELLGSPAGPIITNPGKLVVRTTPPGTNNLFDRNYNPDVAIGEDLNGSVFNPSQVIFSVTFLSEYFNPASFSIVSDGLSVVQGTMDDFRSVGGGGPTQTYNFLRSYNGKPRIAARLSGLNAPRDFSVVMGNANTPIGCSPGVTTSQLHQWWYQTGTGALACPPNGVNLFTASSFYGSGVTSVDPVISCISNRAFYAISFATNATSANRYDIVANTFTQGNLLNLGAFSIVNYGTCSATQAGNQVIPSIASVRKVGSGTTLADYTFNNHLFWDQTSRSLNYKRQTLQNVPGAGTQLRQAEGVNNANDDQTKFLAFPNPTDSEILFDFKLEANEMASEIEIFNIIGQSVDKFSITDQSIQQKRDVSKLPSGTYIAMLKTNLQSHKLQFIRK